MNHEKLIARVDGFAMLSAIVAGLAAAGATLATPTGLTAFGIWLGLIDEPLIITAAPLLDNVATASGTISGFTYFYARRRKRKMLSHCASESSAKIDES
jgi:hypothetical protein